MRRCLGFEFLIALKGCNTYVNKQGGGRAIYIQLAINNITPVGDFNEFHKGQRALTMLIQLPNFSGSPATRFERWIKLFENVVSMSNWSDEEKINMLITKMTDKAHDILQNMLESHTQDYEEIKKLLQQRFHGNETKDFYQKKFENCERKPQESILDYAFRLKTIFNRGYPPDSGETASEEATRTQFLRQKFLQGLEPSLRNKVRYKITKTFEELVNETHKYAIRMDEDREEKDKREFVNAVSSGSKHLEAPGLKMIITAIEKQNETVNAIANSLNQGGRSFEKPKENVSDKNSIQILTDSITKLVDSLSQLQTPHNKQPNAGQNQNSFRSNRPINNNYIQQSSFETQNMTECNDSPRQSSFDNRNRPTQQNRLVTCNFCGKLGHIKQNCRTFQRQAMEKAYPPVCYTCRQIGHISTNCVNKNTQNRPNLPGPTGNPGNA